MQKKNMISIFVCMLLIAVSISSVTGTIDENETLDMKNDDYNNLMKQAFENGVISNDDWLEQDKLLASDGAADDIFGKSVSIDGDYAIVGADRDDDNGVDSGSAYVFTRSGTTWTQQAKLLASDGAADDLFGHSVSIDGDYAIIGAGWDDDNGDDSGSAYVFTRSGTDWTEQAKLLASDGAADDYFGHSVSIDGDYAIVGAFCDDDNGVQSGSAYVFVNSQPPNMPDIDGPNEGTAGEEYTYEVCSTDPDGDDVKYFIDWGDGDTEWTGFSASGTPVIVSHTWVEEDTYTITAKAQDEHGLESDWATLEVEMPVNQQVTNPLLQMILERFPMLERILCLFPVFNKMLNMD